MQDNRTLQELREVGDLVDLREEDIPLMNKLDRIFEKITATLEKANTRSCPEISFPRVEGLEDNLDVLAQVGLSCLVCDLRHLRGYSAFSSLIGKQYHKRVHEGKISEADSVKVGHVFLMAVSKAYPSYIRITQEYLRAGKAPTYCIQRSRTLDKFVELIESTPKFTPVPMVCKPDDWVDTNTGGYLTTSEGYPTPFLRSFTRQPAYDNTIENLPLYYDAVNWVQGTPWKIDTIQLDLVKKAIEDSWMVDSFPFGEDFPELPEYPLVDDKRKYKELSDTEKQYVQEWRTTSGMLETKIQSIKSRRIAITSAVNIAQRHKNFDEIWFPGSMDYRGRLYPYPVSLNPQGSDCNKSLLECGHAEPLESEEAVMWTKIHLAGLYGVDKVSYDDRVDWFDEHEEEILECARSPEYTQFWRRADKPWQFVQACREWAKYVEDPKAPIRLMVAMDGTCSGIQHFSAMLRDAEGGRSVNLLVTDKPQDVYSDIAEVLTEAVKHATGTFAEFWQSVNIDRKATKRPVMTLPYGLTMYSCGKYVLAWIEEAGIDIEDWSLNEVGLWLNRHLWACIRKHLKGAAVVMDFLQECSDICQKEGVPIEWKTTGGLVVSKVAYARKKSKLTVNMSCAIEGKTRVQLILNTPTNKLNSYKLRSSISPNFVHSYDAVHLCMVLVRLQRLGVPTVCAVHDSISVHPNYASQLFTVIREEFVDLYSNRNVLQDLVDHMKEAHGIDLPEPPPFSDDVLDFDEVLNSPYFFN